MVTDVNIAVYTPLSTYPSGYYKTEDFLAGTPLTPGDLSATTDAISLQSPQVNRDDSHTVPFVLGETDASVSLRHVFKCSL